jgi:uncharacterized membrane protein YjdF
VPVYVAHDMGEIRVSRPPANDVEKIAVAIVAVAVLGFGIYGFATGAPTTVGYLVSVLVVGALIAWFRRAPISDPLAIALAVNAIVHLAGGLIQVGDDVLYDASVGPVVTSLDTHLLQYDHFAHGYGSFVATLTLWALLVPPDLKASSRRTLIVLCLFASLGLGGLNESIEFAATLAHSGAHVGGYSNTGWDLISNALGALAGALAIAARPPPPAAPA